jgi:hypothetical protein
MGLTNEFVLCVVEVKAIGRLDLQIDKSSPDAAKKIYRKGLG